MTSGFTLRVAGCLYVISLGPESAEWREDPMTPNSSPPPGLVPVIGVAFAALLAFEAARNLAEPFRPDTRSEAARGKWLRDDYEFNLYLKRGAWAWPGRPGRPYLDVFSEYPQLATWFFGVPFCTSSLGLAGLEAHENADPTKIPPWHPVSLRYGTLLGALVSLAWLGTVACTAALARAIGLIPWRAALCLAPACVYFATQRFDPLPALALAAGLLAIVKGKCGIGFALLGAGTMLKWYPAVVAPIAFGYVARRQGLLRALVCGGIYAVVVGACMAPAFLAGFGDPGWDAPWRPPGYAKTPLGSGLAALAVPYHFQAIRITNPGSLAERWVHLGLGASDETLRGWLKGFKIAQLLPALAALALGVLSPRPRTLVAGAAALVTGFVLFNSIFSPQFVCWILPLVAVAGSGRLAGAALAAGIAIDALTYVQFLLFNLASRPQGLPVLPAAFGPVVDVRIALTVLLLVLLIAIALRRVPEAR
jgi:hypothetical protein